MIYVSQLTTVDGKVRHHNGTPSRKFLKKHPEFVEYYESGKSNEFIYRTTFKIVNASLIEISDDEVHERDYR